MKGQLGTMLARHAAVGRLEWIGLRSARKLDVAVVENADMTETGLIGDHAPAGKRAVTLIQFEHLPVIAALANKAVVAPAQLRRNLVISGINLMAFRKTLVQIGDVVLRIEGPCPPCSRIETALGPGGYNAVRGHGGWYASVHRPGTIRLQDGVTPYREADS